MSKFLRRGALGAAIALSIGVWAVPGHALAAGGQPSVANHPANPRLIDTDIVVGFPQGHPVPTAVGPTQVGVIPVPNSPVAGPGSSSGSDTTGTVTAAGTGGRAPTVTLEPVSRTVKSGALVSFKATASGKPTPTVQWQVMTPGGSFTNISGANLTTYTFTAASSENGNEYQAVFSNTISGVVNTATSNAATLSVTLAAQKSTNWSGYADTGGPFTSVGATWTVPTVTCSGTSTSYSAEWVGIDGYSSSTVEQDGTEADCSSGSPSYDAWYEMYGDNAVDNGFEVELDPAPGQFPVAPLDVMSASVSVSGTTWTLSIADATQNWSFSTQVIFSGAKQSSAEWVVERPEVCSSSCSLTSLADFGSVQFTSASVGTSTTSGTISSYPDALMEMVSSSGSTVLALPGALDPAGDSFTDVWKASS